MNSRKPGWYPQPDLQPGQTRYWDGHQWTDRIATTQHATNATWGVVLALFLIAAVAFGAINMANQFGKM